MKYRDLFRTHKPLIGMIHTDSTDEYTVLDLAKYEIETYLRYGLYPLVENYYGEVEDCEQVLDWLQKTYPSTIYGLNILGDDREAFRLAGKYGAKFIQIDSVCGHLAPKYDAEYAEELAELRKEVDVVLMGGVRFKYQPIASGRALTEDLMIAMHRCDAIVCTCIGTAAPTPLSKVGEFKTIVGNFPVIVGAGVTHQSVKDTFRKADGAIIGSWIKNMHEISGKVNERYVRQIIEIIGLNNHYEDI